MPHRTSQLALVAIDTALPRPDPGGDARVCGPGWFDSSWELHRGLEVREGWSDDDRIRHWIDDFLSAQRAVGRTASPSSSTAIA
ncbi:MAG: hypothetical protein M3Z15_09055 [Pseudomonadota bacterium]|nr:hypothetical protein [Pseudomonadota bacterium]